MYGYLRRYPQLTLQNPEPTSLSRAIGFRRTKVDTFYKNLQDVFAEHNIPPSRIYNCDMTGLSSVQKPQKVFAEKRKERGWTNCERGEGRDDHGIGV